MVYIAGIEPAMIDRRCERGGAPASVPVALRLLALSLVRRRRDYCAWRLLGLSHLSTPSLCYIESPRDEESNRHIVNSSNWAKYVRDEVNWPDEVHESENKDSKGG